MAVYLVTWDLNKEKPNYAQARQNLIAHLERYQHIKDQGLDSVRFVETDNSAQQLATDVRTKMDENDKLVVTRLVSGQYYGWLATSVWDWISPRL
jgi:hypothetical protein